MVCLAYMTSTAYFFNKDFQYFPLICRQKSQFDSASNQLTVPEYPRNNFKTD